MAKKKLIEVAKTLGINTKGLNVAQLKEAIAAAGNASSGGDGSTETNALGTEAAAKKAAAELKAHQAAKKGYIEYEGGLYRFKKSAPKTLNIDGEIRATAHLIEDKAVMLELISGNNSFVERIK